MKNFFLTMFAGLATMSVQSTNAGVYNMKAWNVYLGQNHIDTVFYTSDCDAEYVRDSLVNHDGYPNSITVKKG